MIVRNNKELTSIRYDNKIISYIRKGTTLIWEAIRSCFGNGFWVNDKPWSNDEGWKND